ncbi:Tectonic-2 [Merluccius polli]|uniref:Tectonic-2 n=1 Tax=Merluccius polli TaxID=89951 RepID=A0AA47N242_MERPO|nr:Tectonic-2 [Merluccius polli]
MLAMSSCMARRSRTSSRRCCSSRPQSRDPGIFFSSWEASSKQRSLHLFTPSYAIATGPSLTIYLLGNASDIFLNLRTTSPSPDTGTFSYGDHEAFLLHLALQSLHNGFSQRNTLERGKRLSSALLFVPVSQTAVKLQLKLKRSLQLCGNNETDTDCCPQPLCVLETLQLSACQEGGPWVSMLIQAQIYTMFSPFNPGSENRTMIPNQVYQPLGSCPCDLTSGACDIRCCCDQDCSEEGLKLFEGHCLQGPFGGQVSPVPDYQCSVQSAANAPDWFPFLCVTSPPENNPYLGLFYQGKTVAPKPSPSFQRPVLSAPQAADEYRQGSPIFTLSDQYFTIPQDILAGQCANTGPVAYLKNFNVKCTTLIESCPIGPPLQIAPSDLRVQVKNGQGGVITVDVREEVAVDLKPFISSSESTNLSDEGQVCENVTLAMDYTLFWQANGLTNITLIHTVGTIVLNSSVVVTARYSSVFLSGNVTGQQKKSGNPGYLVGAPVVAGFVDTLDNNTFIERSSINIWQPVNDGVCSTAEMRPIMFGVNATAGCLLAVNLHNLTQCDILRETVASLQASLVTATHVAKSGDPNFQRMADWLKISYMPVNVSRPPADRYGSCSSVPWHQHVLVRSAVTGVVGGVPQREIQALLVSYKMSSWKLECGGGDPSSCLDPMKTQLFTVSSSVTFTDIPVNTGPPKTRFQINFTEYDCDKNDVCWPELAFPLTRYYTGEPYSQSLAKGLILVFFFIAASVLGSPWRQMRQAWRTSSL